MGAIARIAVVVAIAGIAFSVVALALQQPGGPHDSPAVLPFEWLGLLIAAIAATVALIAQLLSAASESDARRRE